jgi:excinuclease UvrABC nuclease subunit
VGKSVNLRRRVRGYFYGDGPRNPRLSEMLRMARQVTVQSTGSDLEARLEEADRILTEKPPYNRALKRRWRGWYLEIRWNEPFPRLRVVRRTRCTGSRYFGPFWGRHLPERIRRLTEKTYGLRSCTEPVQPDPTFSPCIQYDLRLCGAPCAKLVGIDRYRDQVEAAARSLADAEFARDMRDRCVRARDAATERLEFEEAARHQVRLSWMDELEELRFALEPDGDGGSWLIVLPGTKPECRVLQPVASGRVLRRRPVEWRRGRWESAVEDACYAIRVGEIRAPTVLEPIDSVPSLMITRWISEGAPDGLAVNLRNRDASDVIRRLRREPLEATASA